MSTLITPIDPPHVIAAQGGYTQALRVVGARTLMMISGHIPVTFTGDVPQGFEAQCRQVWANLLRTLEASGLGVTDLIKITTYLSDRAYGDINGSIRQEILGGHKVALTMVIAGIFDPAWLLEIEAIVAH